MRDDRTIQAGGTPPRGFARLTQWIKRQEEKKLTPVTVVAFFAFLALMSGLAAAIGYLTHSLAHR